MKMLFKDWILTLNIAVIAYFSPISSLLLSLLVLILVDWGTGVWAAYKTKIPITSFKLRRTLTKLVVYGLALITGLIFEKELVKYFGEVLSNILGTEFQENSLPIVKIIALYIGATEFQSIIENLNKVYKLPFFKVIIDKLQPLQDNANSTIVDSTVKIVPTKTGLNKKPKNRAKVPKRKGKS